MIILEGCVIELAEAESEKYCFNINFLGNRSYVLSAETQDSLECWMRALTCAGFDYMRLMVSELQRQLEEIDKTSAQSSLEYIPPVPPRRQNPFNKFNGMLTSTNFTVKAETLSPLPGNEASTSNQLAELDEGVILRRAPPPPVNRHIKPENLDTARFDIIRDDNELLMFEDKDDFSFAKIHEELGRPIVQALNERRALKESAEKPLIIF